MDELEISGKRYISTQRAGKDNKYHADYIGQLIRAKKVKGQKVGRAWYVDADSLADYLGKEASVKTPARRAEEPIQKVVIEEIAKVKEIEIVEVEGVEETELEPESEVAVEIKEAEKAIPIYRTTREAREAHKGLRYIADEGPLFPQVKKNAIPIRHATPAPIPTRIAERVIEEEVFFETAPRQAAAALRSLHTEALPMVAQQAPSKKRKNTSIFARGAAVLFLGAIVFAVAALASTHLLFTVTVDGGQSANAGYRVK